MHEAFWNNACSLMVVEQPLGLILHFEQQNVVRITTRRAVEQDHHRQQGKFSTGSDSLP